MNNCILLFNKFIRALTNNNIETMHRRYEKSRETLTNGKYNTI